MTRFKLSNMELDFISLVAAGDDPLAQVVIAKAAPEDLEKRDFSSDKRHQLAEKGKALPGGGFPIENATDLRNAIRAIGRATNPEAAKRHIIKRARELGLTDLLPDDWTDSVSKKSSRAYPSLERKKGPGNDNWVEAAGGLPSYIERIAKHLHYEQGMSIGHAIASAVNQCKKWAAGVGGVKPDTRAKAAAAIAQWEAKKGKSKVRKSGEDDFLSNTLTLNKSSREGTLSDMNDQIKKEDLPDEVVAYIETLEDELDARDERLQKAEQDIEALKNKPVEKAAPSDPFEAAISKATPELQEILKAQKAQIEEAQAIAKAERDARLTAAYIAKAEALPMISTDRADLASLLRSAADKLAPEEMAKMEQLLKAANAQIAKGNLFTEMGRSGAETTISKSVEAKAEELRKANPNLTIEQATDLVFQANPDLYTESLKEGAN